MGHFYEDDIKDLILQKKHVFLTEGESTIIFEKGITIGSTIADCLIFSEERGIIGVEIKTEHDSTRRLNKQLSNYSKVCDWVYVLCHDKHVDKVESIIKEKNYKHVGILAYTEFKDKAILGVYQEPTKSPYKDVHMALQMLWKKEIVSILGSFKRQMNTLEEEKGWKVNKADSRSNGLHGLYIQSNASSKLRKTELINMIVSRIGREATNRLLCNIFINQTMHPEKLLKYRYFEEK